MFPGKKEKKEKENSAKRQKTDEASSSSSSTCRFFQPSHFAQHLTGAADVLDESSSPSGGASGGATTKYDGLLGSEDGFVIVETNFRVYAYTDSQHAVLLLNLFVDIDYLLPNLIVGTIKRGYMVDGKDVSEEGGGDVVQGGALSKGVSADQVVRFLRDHAHPVMKQQSNEEMHEDWPVPKTVAEQLRLWEKELPRNRLKCSEARMLKADRFKDEQAWELCYKHAEVMKTLLWGDRRKKWLVVTEEDYDELDGWMRDHSQQILGRTSSTV